MTSLRPLRLRGESFRIAAIILALFTLAGCSDLFFGGSETGVGGIEGNIVDSQDQPIRGAVVTLEVPGNPVKLGSAVTDYFGHFKLTNIAARRNLNLRIVKEFRAHTIQMIKKGVRVGGNHINDLGDIELQAGQ